jgi:hypothetical protein
VRLEFHDGDTEAILFGRFSGYVVAIDDVDYELTGGWRVNDEGCAEVEARHWDDEQSVAVGDPVWVSVRTDTRVEVY